MQVVRLQALDSVQELISVMQSVAATWAVQLVAVWVQKWAQRWALQWV
jgi:hypothetical protein